MSTYPRQAGADSTKNAEDRDIEITLEMIAAGAEVLMTDPSLNVILGPTGAEILAEEILSKAFAIRRQGKFVADPWMLRPRVDSLANPRRAKAPVSSHSR